MKLSKLAILAIKGLGSQGKTVLAQACGVTEACIYKWIATNDDNLTKAAAIKAIREHTGLEDSQILEEVYTEEAAN